MKTLSVFLPFVEPYVASCPKAVARRALVDSAMEFCDRTEIVQETLDPISLRAGVGEYDVTLGGQKSVAIILAAWFNGTLLQPAPNELVRAVEAFRSNVTGATPQLGDPACYYQLGLDSIGVYPYPASAQSRALTVRAASRPRRAATQLDDVLFEDWAEAIAAGALYRLHATPGQAFTDQNQAGRRKAEFEIAVSQARAQSKRGRTRADLTVQLVPFA